MNAGSWIYGLGDWDDPWFADDKLLHFFAAASLEAWYLSAGLFGWRGITLTLLVGALIELVEWLRYRKWGAKGFPQPWPWMTDRVSSKDLLYDAAGAAGMWFLLRGIVI